MRISDWSSDVCSSDLDADDDDRGDVGALAGADQGAEVQLEVLAELQAPVVVRQREAAVDVVCHLLAGGVGELVPRQDDDAVADADTTVLAPLAEDSTRCHPTPNCYLSFGSGPGPPS